jgi:2-polyprenyl-6-methoxyphenol hydroxylase-like FAD-dependent oxidoreductase
MPDRSFNVIIIGAGVGGLTLAQGLHRSGIPVTVYERDADVDSRGQGYRIHLSADGALGISACLPPRLYEAVVATAGKPSHQITIVSHRLKTLRVVDFGSTSDSPSTAPVGFSAPVDRSTLRQILLGGLGDVVHFDKEFARYERLDDGRIRAHFSNVSSADASLLIGADGAGSRVRRQLLPEAELRDMGQRMIFGKLLLDDATRPLLPSFVHHGFGAVIGKHGRGMALGLMQFQTRPESIIVSVRPRTQLRPAPDYLMWTLTMPTEQLPAPDETMRDLSGAGLLQIAQSLTDEWHDDLRALLAASDEPSIGFTPVRIAAPVPPWETTNITLLGDAIHAMSPSGGSGANTALRDAGLLCQKISFGNSGVLPLLEALHDYEAEMLNYGFEAVRQSERGIAQQVKRFAQPFRLVEKLTNRVHRS